jgi:nucleoside-diphosphate-sugar epimerase
MKHSLKSDEDKNTFSKVIVLGSTSYIARHFIKLLNANPNTDVVEVHRGSHPHLFAQESRQSALESLFADIHPSLIANFVGVVKDTPEQCMEWNCYFPRDALTAAANSSPTTKILLLGSAAEYGLRDTPNPIPETAPLLGVTPYALSKIAQSHLLETPTFAHLSMLYARVFNVWGMGMGAETLPGRIQAELNSQSSGPRTIHVTDSNSIRDFVFVESLANDLIVTLEQPEGVGIVNFGTGEGKTVRDFCNMFLDLASKGEAPLITFSESTSPTCSVAELGRLEAIIGGAE